MKRLILLLLLWKVLGLETGRAQQGEDLTPSKFSLGYQLNNYQSDFGMGLCVTSPYFAHKKVAVRLGANWQYHQHADIATGNSRWSGYPMFRVGMIGTHGLINHTIRIYGEGGLVALIPNHNFSDKSLVVGGYGVFGFEFFTISKMAYFIELGGIGTGATADKIPGKEIYSNGFITSVGMRFHL